MTPLSSDLAVVSVVLVTAVSVARDVTRAPARIPRVVADEPPSSNCDLMCVNADAISSDKSRSWRKHDEILSY